MSVLKYHLTACDMLHVPMTTSLKTWPLLCDQLRVNLNKPAIVGVISSAKDVTGFPFVEERRRSVRVKERKGS